MTEWSLPADQQLEFNDVRQGLIGSSHWQRVSQFVRGGFWRNFKVRYPESNEMYARMMQVSGRLNKMSATNSDPIVGELLNQTRTELFRGQCNCSYWHGAFGGIYLPHLRNAVFQHLIRADNLLEQAAGRADTAWCTTSTFDFNFDGRPEVLLNNDKLASYFEPAAGGRMYELDVRNIAHNLLATISRRPEALPS